MQTDEPVYVLVVLSDFGTLLLRSFLFSEFPIAFLLRSLLTFPCTFPHPLSSNLVSLNFSFRTGSTALLGTEVCGKFTLALAFPSTFPTFRSG